MEGQSEGSPKPKKISKKGCDVGCQTDVPSSAQPSALMRPYPWVPGPTVSMAPPPLSTIAGGSSSSVSQPGHANVQQPIPFMAAPSMPTASSIEDAKKIAGPAGVQPNSVADYFADKNTAAPGAGAHTMTNQQPQQQQQQPKARTASTTGVNGEGKKAVRTANSSQTAQQPAAAVPAAAPSSSNANSSNTPAKADAPQWNDENCKLKLTINRFSHLEETVCSDAKIIEGVSWKIMVMPKQHMVQKKQQKCMGFFLQCSPERAYSDQWSVHAIADMRMISYKPNVPHFARRTTHTYTSKENDWGYSCFMTWADIVDESQGYIKDDTVTLEIAVRAEAPKNMMSHEDFLDKIEKWIVLADMQMKKQNIDLALEANSSALKFCKGKDDACYKRLEQQRDGFVNAKLFESIERIEKGPATPVEPTPGKSSNSSLRQALTGAQKITGKISSKNGKKTRAVVTVSHMKKKKQLENGNNQTAKTGNVANKGSEKNQNTSQKPGSDSRGVEKKDGHVKVQPMEDNISVESKDDLLGSDDNEGSLDEEENGMKSNYISDEEDEEEYDDDDEAAEDYCEQNIESKYKEMIEKSLAQGITDPANLSLHEQAQYLMENVEPHYGQDQQNSHSSSSTYDVDEKWEEDNRELLGYREKLSQLMAQDQVEVVFHGSNEDGVEIVDRTTQTMFVDHRRMVDEQLNLMKQATLQQQQMAMTNSMVNFGNILSNEQSFTNRRFVPLPSYPMSEEVAKKMFSTATLNELLNAAAPPTQKEINDFNIDFQNRLGMACSPEDSIERIFAIDGTIPDLTGKKWFTELPMAVQLSLKNKKEYPWSTLITCQKMLRKWFDVEGAIMSDVTNDSVLAKISEDDRRSLIQEIIYKLNPLISGLDIEFNYLTEHARQYLISAYGVFEETRTMVDEGNAIVKTMEERMATACGKEYNLTPVKKNPKEKTVTSAAATSGSGAKASTNGRPTVIAKRTIKNIDAPSPSSDLQTLLSKEFNAGLVFQNETLQDIHDGFHMMNNLFTPLTEGIKDNNKKLQQLLVELTTDNGIAKQLKELYVAKEAQIAKLTAENAELRDAKTLETDAISKLTKNIAETSAQLRAESDKYNKSVKEVKDVRALLKKAENRATKEEQRATTTQVALNDIEEKSKVMKKELDTLKKKTVEEKAKIKKDKDRDSQLLRQQALEISERENERDKVKKELEEVNRSKDKLEKEKKAVAGQVAGLIERARASECSVLEARFNALLEELKRRKDEIQAGFAETETTLMKVRQASDQTLLRKSLQEWKAALDKCDAQAKVSKTEYDHAVEQIKSGGKSLVQIPEFKLPAKEALPKLVKPPPVQVVMPSPPVVVPPPIIPAPAAGVIGQQRAPGSRPSSEVPTGTATTCATTPTRPRVSRIPSPTDLGAKAQQQQQQATPAAAAREETSSLWSWNTIGNLNDLRPSSRNETSFSSTLEQFQRDIWAANGNGLGSIGTDFLRTSNNSVLTPSSMNSAAATFMRPGQAAGQAPQPPVQQQQQQNQFTAQNIRNIRPGGYSDIWGQQGGMQQQQHPQQQENQYMRSMSHNGAGDHHQALGNQYPSMSMSPSPWRAPPPPLSIHHQQQQQQQQHNGGGHQNQNPFSAHSFYDGGM